MTMWTPTLEKRLPRYLAIANAIGRDVDAGVLAPGTRLPTHRSLAQRLGVTVGTVTRAYAEANRRGLTSGEVGRGTYVRGGERFERSPQARRSNGGWLDLTLSTPWQPADGQEGRLLSATLSALVREGELDRLLSYEADLASAQQREIAAQWIRTQGVVTDADAIVVTAGAQQALAVILSTLLRPGDTLLTEALTYPALKPVAQQFGVRLYGVCMDEAGVEPEALRRACRETGAKALYCVPTVQNPTGRVFPEARREEIVAVARQHDLQLIEDAVHVPMALTAPAPLAGLAPERTTYVATLSKWVSFGLRTGFIAAPSSRVERLRSGVRSLMWMPPPLMVEVATRWLADGTAQRLGERKAKELEVRQQLVHATLATRWRVEHHARGLFFWLHLPEGWRTDDFVAQARQRGLLVAGADTFAVGGAPAPQAVRVAISSAESRDDISRALNTLADLLASEPGVPIAVL